jgi:phosphoribosylanthranilate isomerase
MVKICGLRRREDAEAAVALGAGFLGIVLVPETPRAILPREAEAVTGGLGVPVVAVVADEPLPRVAAWARTAGAGVVQLHGEESPAYARALTEEGPWKVWKALRVRGAEEVLRALHLYGQVVDGLLLDGWHPRLRGGSGVAFPWEVVGEVREAFPPGLAVIAAGGLTPENVGEVVGALDPDVVDVSSGVEERAGVKSREKMEAFVRSARRRGKEEET